MKTVEEARMAKLQLGMEICDLITKFQKNYNLSVDEIRLSKLNVYYNGSEFTAPFGLEITVKL